MSEGRYHDHAQGHHGASDADPPDHAHDGSAGWLNRLGGLFSHRHDHQATGSGLREAGEAGIRATKVSLAGLGVTAALQAVVVGLSGSVALLSDTLHNLTDALTSIPLWLAFSLGRRLPTRRYTYGLHRAEDVAGLLIVAAIAASAVFIMLESVRRLFEPRLIGHIPWVIAAGLIGAAGNELVARYRIRVGHNIGSEALVADGQHARADALTSLAVVAAGGGAAMGVAWVDPVAGLMVAAGILGLLVHSARRMTRRLLDGIEPEIVTRVDAVILSVTGVRHIADLKARWHGHQLHVSASVAVDPDLTLSAGHETAHHIEHELHHAFSFPVVVVIHIEPDGMAEAHDSVDHHK